MSVIFSYVGRDFYSALSAKDLGVFQEKTLAYHRRAETVSIGPRFRISVRGRRTHSNAAKTIEYGLRLFEFGRAPAGTPSASRSRRL